MVLAYRDECAAQPSDIGRGHYASLFNIVVKYGKRSCSTRGTRMLETHCLEYFCDRVSDSRGRRKRKVDYAEGNSQPRGSFLSYKLSHPGYLECSPFYRLAKGFKVLFID